MDEAKINDIKKLCHHALEVSTNECNDIDNLIDDLNYEECIDRLLNTKSFFEQQIKQILKILGD